MSNWSAKDVQTGMHIYTSDNQELGHIAKAYEDSMLVHSSFIRDTFSRQNAIFPIVQSRQSKMARCC
jgi:hypothetical protein